MNTTSVTSSVSRKAGGLFESGRRLHQSLAELSGWKVSVLSMRDEFTDADIAQWQPVPTKAFPVIGPAQFGYAPQLLKMLHLLEPEIVQTHGIWMYPSVAVHTWHRKTKRPYLISPHGMVDPWAMQNSRWKKYLARLAYEDAHLRDAACLRALCQSEADSLRACGLKNPIAIIPNGIDLPEMRNAECGVRNPPWNGHIEPGRKVLLYVGRIHPKKVSSTS